MEVYHFKRSGRSGTKAGKLTNETSMRTTLKRKLKRSFIVQFHKLLDQLIRKSQSPNSLAIRTSKIFNNFSNLKMNGYSLVIDISSDEENIKNSTSIKTLRLNMVGRLNITDSSFEAWGGSEADPNASYDSECS